MNRREFLAAAAAAVGLGAIALTLHRTGSIAPDSSANLGIGPRLREGLMPAERDGVPCAVYHDEVVLTTDAEGLRLLKLADGTRSLDELMAAGSALPEATADFYLKLGQNGWLANRLEVCKYAVEA